MNRSSPVLIFAVALLLLSAVRAAESSTGATPLPRQPWHLADIWWEFQGPTDHFESLDVDVTIDRDVPDSVNLYIAPCGLGELGGVRFYGGLQTNINGWRSRTDWTRVHLGKGGIFSRWGQGTLSVEQARGAADSHYEAADYEGDFVSVRRPFAWTKGHYTWSLRATDTQTINDTSYTWVSCFLTSHASGATHFIGSLRFEGTDLTYWKQHAAFVEVYSTAPIRVSAIPEVNVTFGYPRVNGRPPPLKGARVIHPGPGQQSGSPDCATAVAAGSDVVVSVGKIFARKAEDRRYALQLQPPNTPP